MPFPRASSVAAALVAAGPLLACASSRTNASRVDVPALESDLRSSLARDARLAAGTSVHVDPATGIVRLSGRVASAEERRRAGRLASSVKGVTIVYNEIEVQRLRR
jgi:osmotically-inducible protein OsmY